MIAVAVAVAIYSESELSGSFKRSLIIYVVSAESTTIPIASDIVQPALELVDLGLLDQNVFFVQLLDNVFIVVLAVNVDQHGLDGRVASHECAFLR